MKKCFSGLIRNQRDWWEVVEKIRFVWKYEMICVEYYVNPQPRAHSITPSPRGWGPAIPDQNPSTPDRLDSICYH